MIYNNNNNQIPLLLIFHENGSRLSEEFDHYHPGVLVEFNSSVYLKEDLFLINIIHYLISALKGMPTCFALDLIGSHKTRPVLAALCGNQILLCLIPGRCTNLVQPLHVSINNPSKEIIRDLTDQAIPDCKEADEIE